MENVKRNLYLKLNNMADEELAGENPDMDFVCECVDSMLRLLPEKAYQITEQQRREQIQNILENNRQKKKLSKVAKALLVAAIIIAFLLISAVAYTVVQYEIHDYGTYSEVWANITSKKLDKPVEVGYVPEGFELVDEEFSEYYSCKTYSNKDINISFDKTNVNSTNVNTEYQSIKRYTIDNIEYFIFGEEIHGKGIVWATENYIYSISAPLDDTELLKMAQSTG